jgi:Uma2 family endonuclease
MGASPPAAGTGLSAAIPRPAYSGPAGFPLQSLARPPPPSLYTSPAPVYTYPMSEAARKIPDEDRPFTYADYKAWELKEGERFELIEGAAYAMAAPNDSHQAILLELALQMGNHLRGKPCKVRLAPYDVRLFYAEDESDDTVVQPDISVICDENKRGPEGCRGAPDLVVEILSPSNTAEEMAYKFNLYIKAGVREYWVVAPSLKLVQSFVLQNNAFTGTVYKSTAALPSATLEGLSISLSDVFAG